jgi:uncharacterized protein (TIGR00730 family)
MSEDLPFDPARLTVFCGARPGVRPEYVAAAEALGRTLVRRGLGLVFGGGHVGLMGTVADATLAAGGEVIGVIPQKLVDRELAHQDLTQLHVVETMHQRKALMAGRSGGFVVLPGGWGTLEEMFEVLTWTQLGFHDKPVGILDVEGYYDGLWEFLDRCMREGFIDPASRGLLVRDSDPDALIDRLAVAARELAAREDR